MLSLLDILVCKFGFSKHMYKTDLCWSGEKSGSWKYGWPWYIFPLLQGAELIILSIFFKLFQSNGQQTVGGGTVWTKHRGSVVNKKVLAGELCALRKSTQAPPDPARAWGARHLEEGQVDSLSVFLFSVCLVKAVILLSHLLSGLPCRGPERALPRLCPPPPPPHAEQICAPQTKLVPSLPFPNCADTWTPIEPVPLTKLWREQIPSTNIGLFFLEDFCLIFLEDFCILKGTKSQTGLCWDYCLWFKAAAVEWEQLEMRR